MRPSTRTAVVTLCAALLLPSCAGSIDDASVEPSAPTEAGSTVRPGLIETATAREGLASFVRAVEAAGLTDTLQSDGPFTIFAPTDEAFAVLPSGLLDRLLLPENARLLARIVTYHVVPGQVLAGDIVTGRLATVEGFDLRIDTSTGMRVNGANFLLADLRTSNGVIHIIDAVLLPPDLDVDTL
jgi:uncharacterized surface protein with fasciclin (FAS1) repeats